MLYALLKPSGDLHRRPLCGRYFMQRRPLCGAGGRTTFSSFSPMVLCGGISPSGK
jgi:hypothetical protein